MYPATLASLATISPLHSVGGRSYVGATFPRITPHPRM
jgi:hypothetical protein